MLILFLNIICSANSSLNSSQSSNENQYSMNSIHRISRHRLDRIKSRIKNLDYQKSSEYAPFLTDSIDFAYSILDVAPFCQDLNKFLDRIDFIFYHLKENCTISDDILKVIKKYENEISEIKTSLIQKYIPK